MEKLDKILQKYDLYPEKVIFSTITGFGWFATDHDKIVELDEEDEEVIKQFTKTGTLIVYIDGSGVMELSEEKDIFTEDKQTMEVK